MANIAYYTSAGEEGSVDKRKQLCHGSAKASMREGERRSDY